MRPPRNTCLRGARRPLAVAAGAGTVLAVALRARPRHTPVAPLHGIRTEVLHPAAVVLNPSSGSADEVSVDDVPVRVPAEGEDLMTVIRDQADAGVATLGVAGGDGTVRCAAQVALERDLTLWVLPGGTLNHFAVALGLRDMETSRRAFAEGRTARVDVGQADAQVFVNTLSVGVYGEVVRRREALEDRLPKTLALMVALAATLRSASPVTVSVDGRPERVWLVFVGNGAYSGVGLTGRERLQEGVLDLRVLRAHGPLPRLTVLARLLAGRLNGSPWLRQSLVREVRLDLPEPLPLSLDGEVAERSGPITVRSRRMALRVVVPEPSAG